VDTASPCKLTRKLLHSHAVVTPSVWTDTLRMPAHHSSGLTRESGQNERMADTQPHANNAASTPTLPPFEVLFERYEKGIFNLIYRMVGDMEDATDLTSQTFLHALRAYDRFRGEAQAYTWLYRIAVNLCKNHFRKRDREARFQLVSLDAPLFADGEEMERDIEDLSQSPERMMEGQELQVLLQEAIAALPPDLRTVILLRDVQGLSYQEVADITGCTVEAVKSRIFRARGHLRRVLGPYLHPQQSTDDCAPQEDVSSPKQRRQK